MKMLNSPSSYVQNFTFNLWGPYKIYTFSLHNLQQHQTFFYVKDGLQLKL